MSQVTLLGFTTSGQSSPSQGVNSLHWSILLSPTAASQSQETTAPVSTKKSKFFSSKSHFKASNKDVSAVSATPQLFDMHNHQLRQQDFPQSVKSSTDARQATTNISSDIPGKPYNLTIRILLTIHSLPVTKLATKVSSLLERTPTYGSGEDWLRAAIDMLIGGSVLSPPSFFDTDAILGFAGEAINQYLTLCSQDQPQIPTHEVLELDYARHLRDMDSVRTMFSHHSPANETPQGTRPKQPTRSSSHNYFNITQSQHSPEPPKTHKFWGFTISPSPNSIPARQRWNTSGSKGIEGRTYYERAERYDPYGGLM
jgi:hypothetical protein